MARDQDTENPGDVVTADAALGRSLAGKPILVLKGATTVHRLDKDRLVIGSVVSADVRLAGDGVAPIHAVLEVNRSGVAQQATIYDLASDTGVFVNGSKVITHELREGDEITIGRHRLQFSMESRTKTGARDRVRESGGRKLFLDPEEDFTPLLLQDSRDVEDIFDYRPTSRPALEVVMSWAETILDVEHFVSEKAVTIGNTRKSDFGIPPILASSKYAIVTRTGEGFVLNLDPQMKGVMHRQGRLQPLSEVINQSRTVTVGKDDFAKISVGEVDFYFSYTAAPPRLKRRRLFAKDPFFSRILVSSLLLTALTLYGLLQMKVPQTLEAEQVPERIATILYQPEKFPPRPTPKPPVQVTPPVEQPTPIKTPEPKATTKLDIKPKAQPTPKPVPKTMVSKPQPTPKAVVAAKPRPAPPKGGDAGEGAKAQGTAGKRGTKTGQPSTKPDTKAQRPSPTGGKGAGGGNSQVSGLGNVDFLKSAGGKIENILGNTAAQLGKSGSKLKGFGGFNTQGNDGLALSGAGKGGGGTSDLGQGLGTKGIGGGRVGTGAGAVGSGGILGGQMRVPIRTGGTEEAVVMGAIDADAVEAALLAHKDEFRLCYEREINAEHPNLSGRVGTSFVIGPTGRVTQAGIESSSLKNPNAERCIIGVIKRIDFPVPRGGGIVQVTYPFKFNAVGR